MNKLLDSFRNRPSHLSAESLSAMLDGELSSREIEGAEAHLAGCDDCRMRYAQLLDVRTMLRAVPAEEPGRSFHVREAIPAEAKGANVFGTPRFAFAGAMAAMLAVIAIGAIIAANVGDGTEQNAPQSARVANQAPAAADTAKSLSAGAAQPPPSESFSGAPPAAATPPNAGALANTNSGTAVAENAPAAASAPNAPAEGATPSVAPELGFANRQAAEPTSAADTAQSAAPATEAASGTPAAAAGEHNDATNKKRWVWAVTLFVAAMIPVTIVGTRIWRKRSMS